MIAHKHCSRNTVTATCHLENWEQLFLSGCFPGYMHTWFILAWNVKWQQRLVSWRWNQSSSWLWCHLLSIQGRLTFISRYGWKLELPVLQADSWLSTPPASERCFCSASPGDLKLDWIFSMLCTFIIAPLLATIQLFPPIILFVSGYKLFRCFPIVFQAF